MKGEDGKQSVDLTSFVMACEKKHSEEAFANLLWKGRISGITAVGPVFIKSGSFMDDVSLTATEEPKVIGISPSAGMEFRQRFRFRFKPASQDRSLSVVNILINKSWAGSKCCLQPSLFCYLWRPAFNEPKGGCDS